MIDESRYPRLDDPSNEGEMQALPELKLTPLEPVSGERARGRPWRSGLRLRRPGEVRRLFLFMEVLRQPVSLRMGGSGEHHQW